MRKAVTYDTQLREAYLQEVKRSAIVGSIVEELVENFPKVSICIIHDSISITIPTGLTNKVVDFMNHLLPNNPELNIITKVK